jgi:hypothetical protein
VCLVCVSTETPKRGPTFKVGNDRKMNEEDIYPSVCLSIYIAVYLSISLSVRPSVRLFVYLPVIQYPAYVTLVCTIAPFV